MPLIVKEEKGQDVNFKPSENNHLAVCVGVWDIGYSKTEFNGEVKIKQKVLFRWEVDEKITSGEYEGKYKCINKTYNLSFHEKSTLRKDLESWRGKFTPEELKGFDLEELVGANCMLNILYNENAGKVYANISSISKTPKGLEVFTPDNLYKDIVPEFVESYRDRNRASMTADENDAIEFNKKASAASEVNNEVKDLYNNE